MCVCVCVLRSGQADMAAVYYEKIDVEGHHFGPDSPQVRTAVRQLDVAMQMLNNKIRVCLCNYSSVYRYYTCGVFS